MDRMILLGYDTETTGLDKNNDRIIEGGLVLYSTGMNRVLESAGFLLNSDGVPISEENYGITGIHPKATEKYGYEQSFLIGEFGRLAEEADAIIGHNVNNFDRLITENTFKRLNLTLPDKLWIDTMTDIPGVKGEQLVTMCAKMGFVNDQHEALADARSTIEMAYRHTKDDPVKKSWEKIVERAQSPMVLLRSHQGRNNNEDAKKFKFRWNPDNKIWWKPAKEMDIEELVNQAPFEISRLDKTFTMEMLDN